jgi:hypothetical protein
MLLVKYDRLGWRTRNNFCPLTEPLVKTERIQMNTKIHGQHSWTWLIAMLIALFLTACGGGGGENGGTSRGESTAGGGGGGSTPPPATGTNPPPAATQLAISSTSPAAGGAGIALNTAPRVAFNVKVDPATIVSLEPTAFTMRDVTNGNNVGGSVQLDADGMTAIFTPRNNLVPNAQYAVTVSTAVKSSDGTSLAENHTWNFTAAAPAVESTYPASGATALAINSKIAVVFNTNIDPATLNIDPVTRRSTSFTLTTGGTQVLGTVAYDDTTRTAVFTPDNNLQPGASYTATVTNAVPEAATWTFTTATGEQQLDTVKPTVTFSPADNTENVGINSGIKVTFSEAINLSKINGGTFFVSDESHVHLSGNIVIDAENNTATFLPERAMAPNTPYHIVVSDAIEDLAGNKLDTGSNTERQSRFTTGAR